MKREDIIARTPLFESLEPEQLEELSRITMEKFYEKGAMIFSEGDECSGFYVVIDGRVKIFKLSPDGREQILHIFENGEPFGEVPVFSGKRFPASSSAIVPSRLLFFPKQDFISLIEKRPKIAIKMVAVLSMRLRRFVNLIEDLSLKEVPSRLASYILYVSKRDERAPDIIELDIKKSQLASLLGTIPETLSRILSKMKRQGIIDMEGSKIRILDTETLKDLADSTIRLI